MRLRTIVAGVMLLHSLPVLAQTNVVTNPVGSQDIVQPVNTQTSTNNLGGIRYVTAIFRWSQSPVADLSIAGAGKTITLAPCPLGIDTSAGANKDYYVYISTQGTPEAALVTGGTCTGGAASGTVIVTTVNAHSAGYTVGSAYSGIQEALNDAGAPGAYVKVTPAKGQTNNSWPVYAPIIEQNNGSVLDGGGVALNCNNRSRCIQVGSLADANSFGDILVKDFRFGSSLADTSVSITNTVCASNTATITTATNTFVTGDYIDIQGTGTPAYWGIHKITVTDATHFTYTATGCSIGAVADMGFAALENAAVEDSINHGIYENLQFDTPGGITGKFNNLLVIDNDQSVVITKLNEVSGPRCSTGKYCGQVVYAPGPFSTNASVLYVDKSNLSLQCSGNGITNYGGNTLSVSDTVIQGFNQWAVNTGLLRGGFGPTILHNVYNEVGSCSNPNYDTTKCAGSQCAAEAGILAYGGEVSAAGGEAPIGGVPAPSCTGGGSTQFNYWVIPHDSVLGYGTPLLAMQTSATCNQTGTITLQHPRIQGTNTVTYDYLRTTGSGAMAVAPYFGNCGGGSITACGSIAVGQAQCSTAVCSFTDTASANTTSYTLPISFPYLPVLAFWPGSVVLTVSGDTTTVGSSAKLYMDTNRFSGYPVSVGGYSVPSAFFAKCAAAFPTNTWVVCVSGDSVGTNFPVVGATLLQSGNAIATDVKGRLNFSGLNIGTPPFDVITIDDANARKTLATSGYRPLADAADAAIGFDQGTGGTTHTFGMFWRAQQSLSQYINSLGDNVNWLERLTATLKTFKVPITTNSQITSTLATGTAPLAIASTTSVANLTVSNHPKVQGCGTTTACSHSALTGGQIVFGQVALAAGLATVTGISPAFSGMSSFQCTASDRTTAGNAANAVPASASSIAVRGTSTDVISYICVGN